MCFFDSPIARCEVAHEMVLTDETQKECAREHGCAPGTQCPLCGHFTGPACLPEVAHFMTKEGHSLQSAKRAA